MRFLTFVGAAALLSAQAGAQIINFERTQSGAVPTDDANLTINTPFIVNGPIVPVEVRIGVDKNLDGVRDTALKFERFGPDANDAFNNFLLGAKDTADLDFSQQLGAWMVRSAGSVAEYPIFIDYSAPVTGVSGEIWDIEGRGDSEEYEQWLVEALDSSGNVLASALSPAGIDDLLPLDGEPWVFSLAADNIIRVRITFVGDAEFAGFVFNNLNATAAVEGPTFFTHQPDSPVSDAGGVPHATLYWDEPITIRTEDVTVVSDNGAGLPVPFKVLGSRTQVTTIMFTGAPGGIDTGVSVPLTEGAYEITVHDSARATENNYPIDGDADGVAGGDLTISVASSCLADCDGNGILNLDDLDCFVASFLSGCN